MSEQTNKLERNATKEFAESGEIAQMAEKFVDESVVTVDNKNQPSKKAGSDPDTDREDGSQQLDKKQSTLLMEHEKPPQSNLQVNQSFQKSDEERRSISR